MKGWAAVGISVLLLPGCNITQPNQHVSHSATPPPVAEQDPCSKYRTNLITPYQEKAEFEVTHIEGLGCLTWETGLVNGVEYRISHDEPVTAIFQSSDESEGVGGRSNSWAVKCETDSMTDARSCTIRRNEFFLFWQSGAYFISLLGDQYPHTDIVFRVDSKNPISAREDVGVQGRDSQRLISQMESGNTLRTRYTDWPYGTYQDSEMSASGFSEALEYMMSIR